jgi:hypothetical protein
VTEYLPMLSPVPPPPPIAEITLLSIPLACVGLSRDTEERNSERVKKYIVWPERALAALERERGEAAEGGSSGGTPLRRRRSMSPARPFMSYTRTEDGASVLTEVRVLRAMFSTREEKADLLSAGELDGISESELTGGEEDDLDVSDTESVGDNDNENSANESGSDTDADAPPPSPSPQTSPQRHGHSLPGTPTDFCNGNGSIPIHWAGACSSTSSSAATTPPTYSARSNFGLGVAVGVGMTHIYPAHLRTQSETERSVRILHGLRPRRASECTPRRYNFDDEDEVQPRVSRSMRCLQLDLRGIGGTDDTHMGECTKALAGAAGAGRGEEEGRKEGKGRKRLEVEPERFSVSTRSSAGTRGMLTTRRQIWPGDALLVGAQQGRCPYALLIYHAHCQPPRTGCRRMEG